MKKIMKYKIDECPHCKNDEICRVAARITVKKDGKYSRRQSTQTKLYWCHACCSLIEVNES